MDAGAAQHFARLLLDPPPGGWPWEDDKGGSGSTEGTSTSGLLRTYHHFTQNRRFDCDT